MNHDLLTIGTFNYLSNAQAVGGVVQGAAVAIADADRAILRCGDVGTVNVVCAPEEAGVLRRCGEPKIVTHSYFDALDRPPIVSAWFDGASDVRRPFAFRSHAGGAYPIAVLHHSVSYHDYLHGWFLRLLTGDVRPCDSIICTSRAARDAIRVSLDRVAETFNRAHGSNLSYAGRLDVIPIGIDTERFRPSDKVAARASLGLPPNDLVLLWVGRLSAATKADLIPLLMAFASLPGEINGRALRLVIGGSSATSEDGFLMRHAEALGVSGRVHFVRVHSDTRHMVYPIADVFVSPVDNVQETFGLTPIEAMSCGIPQVVSDWDGYRDTVVDGETGFLVPTLWTKCDFDANAVSCVATAGDSLDHFIAAQSVAVDQEALRDRILRIVSDDALRARMGEASRKRAVDAFDWSVITSRYVSLWRELGEVARGTKQAAKPDHERSAIFDTYRGYASGDVGGRDVVLTDSGAALQGSLPITSLPRDTRGAIDAGVLSAVIGSINGAIPVSVLAARVAESCRVPNHRAQRHIMYAIKYGLVRVVGGSL